MNKVNRLKRAVERRRSSTIPKNEIKSTVGFMVRIHEARHSSREIKTALRKLRLTKKYDGMFVRLDEAGIASLKPYENYIAYGYLSERSVIDLVRRRSFTNVKGPRRPITDNVTVEELLGEDILCLNDLSREIFTVGPRFDEAISVLSPFSLAAPVGTFEKKILKVHNEVEKKGGFIGDKIEEFLLEVV